MNQAFCVAKTAPYGNDLSSPFGVKVQSGRLVYFDLPDGSSISEHELAVRNGSGMNDSLHGGTQPVGANLYGQKVMSPLPQTPRSPNHNNNNVALPDVRILESLRMRTGCLSEDEETQVIAELLNVARFIEPQRLSLLESELRDYDPYAVGLVDVSTVHAICCKHLKQVTIQPTTYQLLFRMFARDPKKPRQIYFEKMLEYLRRLMDYKGHGIGYATMHQQQQQDDAHFKGPATAQTPCYERGDAKLISLLQACLAHVCVSDFDMDKLHQHFNIADRQHSGTLDYEQVEQVLRSFGLWNPLASCLHLLLKRSDRTGDKCYDWSTIVRFIEKSLPSCPNSPAQASLSHSSNSLNNSQQQENHQNITENKFHLSQSNSSFNGSGLAKPQNGQNGSANNNSSSSNYISPNRSTESFNSVVPLNLSPVGTSSPCKPLASMSINSNNNFYQPAAPNCFASDGADVAFTFPTSCQSQQQRILPRNDCRAEMLENMTRQMQMLQFQRNELQQKISFDSASMKSKIRSIIDAMSRADHNRTGWLPLGRARSIAVTCGDLCGLKFDQPALEAVLISTADSSERAVCIAQLQDNLATAVSALL